jgi:uncharacterized membrane protein YccC
MKNLILGTTAVIFLGSSLAIANSDRGGRGIERLQAALGLTAEQSTQVEGLMQQHRQQMESLRQQLEQNMQGVLSAEQFTRFREMQQPQGRGGKHSRGQRQERMPAQ